LSAACLVTGISTGAVMAPYVFLATSENPDRARVYRALLKELYTKMDDRTLLRKRSVVEQLTAASIYDVAGMKAEIKSRVDDTLLANIADEAKNSGRILVVGATDLLSGEFEVVNLTDLAMTRRADCVAEVIRASAAIPILFPPVAIINDSDQRERLYADGGVRHDIFLANLLQRLGVKRAGTSTAYGFYGILNYDFQVDPAQKLPQRLLPLVVRNTELVMDQLYYDAAFVVDRRADDARMSRNWSAALKPTCSTSMPPECRVPPGKIFDPDYQACLSCFATEKVRRGEAWKPLNAILPYS
jgi:hypothetical protein